ELGAIKSGSQVAGKRKVRRIYSLEAQFVQRQAKSIFQGAPLRCALGLRQSGVEFCHAYPALSDTTPRETRGGVARTGLLSAVPLCGTGAIMVRVYRQPDERLSTQRPERLTRILITPIQECAIVIALQMYLYDFKANIFWSGELLC